MADFICNDPAVIITGGSRGIGKSIAKTLARKRYMVLLTYASRAEDAQETVRLIESGGGLARAFQLDVGDGGAVKEFFAKEIKDRYNLRALVNNAGITQDGLILRMSDDAFSRVININLEGAFRCIREAAKIMSRNRFGRIVNISSVVGQMGNPGQANYSASKSGLFGLTMSCAKELASRNITVNAVAPGFIETDMTAGLEQNIREEYIKAIPLGRLGTPEDIANAVAFLLSDVAAYITGQTLAVNGGMFCH